MVPMVNLDQKETQVIEDPVVQLAHRDLKAQKVM